MKKINFKETFGEHSVFNYIQDRCDLKEFNKYEFNRIISLLNSINYRYAQVNLISDKRFRQYISKVILLDLKREIFETELTLPIKTRIANFAHTKHKKVGRL